jgi:hypothetical protein
MKLMLRVFNRFEFPLQRAIRGGRSVISNQGHLKAVLNNAGLLAAASQAL